MRDIIIDADYREKRSGVIEALQNRTGVTVNPVFLEYGDYRINHLWLLERKTLTDLAASHCGWPLIPSADRILFSISQDITD